MLTGRGEMPWWAAVLVMAEKWGVPPWVIEEQINQEWYDRWTAFEAERAWVEKQKAKR